MTIIEATPTTSFALQPVCGPVAQRNFTHTVRRTVPLDDLAGLLSQRELERLVARDPRSQLQFWGLRRNSNNMSGYPSLRPGATALFYWEAHFRHQARVTHTLVSQDIAEEYWGDRSYELLYLVDDLQPIIPLPYSSVAADLRWSTAVGAGLRYFHLVNAPSHSRLHSL